MPLSLQSDKPMHGELFRRWQPRNCSDLNGIHLFKLSEVKLNRHHSFGTIRDEPWFSLSQDKALHRAEGILC